MRRRIKLFDLKDWPSWSADYISAKLNSIISSEFKRKRTIFNTLFSNNITIKKVTSNVYDLYCILNSVNCSFRMRLNESDPEVFDQVILKKEYLPLVNLINEKKIEPHVLIDLGANTGYTSIYLSSFFNFETIVLVEPNQETFEILKHNIEKQSLKTQVIYENKGVWNKTGKVSVNPLFRDGKAWSYSLIEDNQNGQIPVINIKDLIENNKISKIDILKIDIEGAESVLFADQVLMTEVLSKTKIIAIEIHDEFECRSQIENVLTDCRFSFFQEGELTIGFNSKLGN
jgi:FkbM family methyltransferase